MNRYGQKIKIDRDFAYKGVNAIIQSDAARLMKRALIRCHAYLEKIDYAWLLLPIHDELISEFKKSTEGARHRGVLRDLKTLMENQDGLYEVETPVDFDVCETNWLERKPYEL